jgi:hypothetical protein
MIHVLILPILVGFSILNCNPERETIELKCGPNLSEVLHNTKLSNGEILFMQCRPKYKDVCSW